MNTLGDFKLFHCDREHIDIFIEIPENVELKAYVIKCPLCGRKIAEIERS